MQYTAEQDFSTMESGYTPEMNWPDDAVINCESVQVNDGECLKSVEVFMTDDFKVSGMKFTTSDDSELSLAVTDETVTSAGSAYFGDNGCLSNIEPFTDDDGHLNSFIFYSIDEIVIEETGEVNTISCTLDREATCGLHVPYITTNMGLLPNDPNMEHYRIDCTIVDVWPYSELNLLAIDNLTLSGTQFPWDISNSEVEMTFNDDDLTPCIPQVSQYDELVCLTQPFNINQAGNVVGITVWINGVEVENDIQLTLMTETRSGVLFDPATASPVLKTQINITLEDDFPYEMFKEDFSVNATNISNPEYFRPMNVIAVYDDLRTLTAMFGGAWSGDYTIDIRHRAYGLVDTRGLTFIVGSNVTSVSPQTGSKYGGTLITITGNNFGTVPTDNPVQISTLGAVGSVDCFVQTINEEQITCRVDATD
jgi:hypothetical protein